MYWADGLEDRSTVHLQEWHVQAPPRPSTHSKGGSCIATVHVPLHLLQADTGNDRAGRQGEVREGEEGSKEMRKAESDIE